MSEKKILFKINQFPHLSETFIVAQLITAKKLGFEVYLLVKEILNENIHFYQANFEEHQLLKNVIYEDYKIPKNKLLRLAKWLAILIINIHRVNFILSFYKTYDSFSLTYLFQWFFYKKLKNFDIIHIQYGNHKSPVDRLKRTGFFKPATIVSFHGHDAFFPMHGHIPNNGYYDFYFESGDLVTVNTPYLEEKVKDLGCFPNKLKVIPVAVDTTFFYPPKERSYNQNVLKLINVGRLDKIKGQKYLIHIVSSLIEQGCNIQLTIIGEGSEYNSLKNDIIKNNLGGSISLLGIKTQAEIREAFQNHDVYVFTPTALIDGRSETQGLATLEAQATGIPAVVFDSGGVKYTVEDNLTGFICKEGDAFCMVDKIKYLYDNPEIRRTFGLNATEFVQSNFSQSKIDEQWNHIYNSLIKI